MAAGLKAEEEEGESKRFYQMAITIEKIKEERKSNKLSFMLKGANEVFANTIRRLIIEEVPTLAVEDLEIRENNSALYDEMLGLRIGLIPLKTDLKSYNLKEKCKCGGEGCAQCELKLTLKSNKPGYVYAEEAESSDPKCAFVYGKMPIVKLLAKQKLDVTMTAVLGTGKTHIKWAPGMSFYKKEPVVKLGKIENSQRLIENCTDGVFVIKNNNISLVQEKVNESQLLEYYSEIEPGVTVEYSNNIIFNLESWGQLSCREILKQSVNIFIEKIEEMEKLI